MLNYSNSKEKCLREVQESCHPVLQVVKFGDRSIAERHGWGHPVRPLFSGLLQDIDYPINYLQHKIISS